MARIGFKARISKLAKAVRSRLAKLFRRNRKPNPFAFANPRLQRAAQEPFGLARSESKSPSARQRYQKALGRLRKVFKIRHDFDGKLRKVGLGVFGRDLSGKQSPAYVRAKRQLASKGIDKKKLADITEDSIEDLQELSDALESELRANGLSPKAGEDDINEASQEYLEALSDLELFENFTSGEGELLREENYIEENGVPLIVSNFVALEARYRVALKKKLYGEYRETAPISEPQLKQFAASVALGYKIRGAGNINLRGEGFNNDDDDDTS